MKFLLKMSTLIGIAGLVMILCSYISCKQWENAMCIGCCIALLISCRYHEWRREELEKTNNFIVGNFYGKAKITPYDIENILKSFENKEKEEVK